MAGVPLGKRSIHSPFPKPYFHTTLCGYIAGLAFTLVVMIKFQAAQPALLYLVPGVLLSSFGCAVWRGELADLLKFEEATGNDEKEAKEATKKAD